MEREPQEELEIYSEGTLEYGALMQMEAYDNALRVISAVAAEDHNLYTTQDLLDIQDALLDMRNELEVGNEL